MAGALVQGAPPTRARGCVKKGKDVRQPDGKIVGSRQFEIFVGRQEENRVRRANLCLPSASARLSAPPSFARPIMMITAAAAAIPPTTTNPEATGQMTPIPPESRLRGRRRM